MTLVSFPRRGAWGVVITAKLIDTCGTFTFLVPLLRQPERRRQRHAASAEGRHASIQHALHPAEFIPAQRPRACGVGTTDGKVDGYHQFAITDDDYEEDPINTREHPVFLAAPPGAHEAQLCPILFEYGVIAHPGPLPAAACGLALAGGVTPQGCQHLQPQASEPLDPGASLKLSDFVAA